MSKEKALSILSSREMAITLTLLLACSIGLWAPLQGTVIVFKICLVTLASLSGYWVDRILFPYGRPHSFKRAMDTGIATGDDPEWIRIHARNFHVAQMRRAAVILACVLGVCLGL